MPATSAEAANSHEAVSSPNRLPRLRATRLQSGTTTIAGPTKAAKRTEVKPCRSRT
jgi:hypothetical protein